MQTSSIKKNYFYNLLYNLFSLILPLITVPYASKILEPDGIGIQSFTSSITTYFILFGSLGIASYGRREVAMARDKIHYCSILFWELTILRCVTTSISLIGYVFVIMQNETYSLYLIANIILIVASIIDFTWFFQGIENFKLIVYRNIMVRIIGTICLFIFINKKNDLLLYVLILAITTFVANLSVLFKVFNYIERISVKELRVIRHLKEILVYFIPTIATSIYTILDKLMLGIMVGSKFENGYYEQSERIIDMAKNVLFSLNVVVGARISYLYAQKKIEEIKKRLVDSIQFVMILSIPMTMGIYGISTNFVYWFLGEPFQKCALLLKILSPLIIIVGISNCIGGQCLTPIGKRRQSNVILCIGAAINLLCNLVMIPMWQSIGAAIATIIAETVIAILYLFLAKEYYSTGYILRISIKYLLAGGGMLFVLITLEDILSASIWHTFIEIFIGTVVYGLILIVLREKSIISKIRQILNIHITSKD